MGDVTKVKGAWNLDKSCVTIFYQGQVGIVFFGGKQYKMKGKMCMSYQNPSAHKVGQFPIIREQTTIQLMHHTVKTLNLVIKHLPMHKSLVCVSSPHHTTPHHRITSGPPLTKLTYKRYSLSHCKPNSTPKTTLIIKADQRSWVTLHYQPTFSIIKNILYFERNYIKKIIDDLKPKTFKVTKNKQILNRVSIICLMIFLVYISFFSLFFLTSLIFNSLL